MTSDDLSITYLVVKSGIKASYSWRRNTGVNYGLDLLFCLEQHWRYPPKLPLCESPICVNTIAPKPRKTLLLKKKACDGFCCHLNQGAKAGASSRLFDFTTYNGMYVCWFCEGRLFKRLVSQGINVEKND